MQKSKIKVQKYIEKMKELTKNCTDLGDFGHIRDNRACGIS
jgi:hypothetical protein